MPIRLLPLILILLAAPLVAVADEPVAAPSGTVLTGVRSFPGPTTTRLVFSFSRGVAYVAPDSGNARRVRITVPGEPVGRGTDVPVLLTPGDGVVDTVRIETGTDGARFELTLHAATHFAVFGLAAEGDKPYRLVVDVTRPGGAAAQEQKLASVASRKSRDRVRIVAIDAGHRGDDPGARGPRGVLEKNVTLAVAKALAEELGRMPGIKPILVRDSDYFIPLQQRYRIAEKAKADLFISIHCNSSRRRGSGSGTEVYFLSLRGAADQASQDLADLENAADKVGGVPPQAEDELVNILYDVKRTSALQQSQLLAESILDKVAADRLASRGIKQAGFVVLKSVEFPSVLVETAFINNPSEAKLLASPEFQRKISRQIASGVKGYFEKAGIPLGNVEVTPPTGAGAAEGGGGS
jgi:N-acetylmuramoyl-L-alanine amidase